MAAGKVIREFLTRWGFDADTDKLDKFEQGLDRVQSVAKKVAIGAVGATTALYGLAVATAKQGDDAAKTARNLGLTAESLQEIWYAAGLSGLAKEQINDMLKDLQKNSSEAAAGQKELRSELRKLGIDAKVFNELSADEKLEQLVDAMKDVKNPADAARIRMKLMGEQGVRAGSLFAAGSEGIRAMREEARLLGYVIDEETTKKAEAMNDSIDRLKTVAKGFAFTVGKELLPAVTEGATEFKNFIVANAAVTRVKLVEWVREAIAGIREFILGVRDAIAWVQQMVDSLGGLSRVLTIVKIALATFVTYKAVLGFMGLVKFIRGAIVAYRTLGATALLAQAKVLLLPVAIAALLVLIALVAEDFQKFFAGQDSAIGELVKRYPELGEVIYFLRDLWQEMGLVAEEFFDWLLAIWPEVEKAVGDFGVFFIDLWYDIEVGAKRAWANIREYVKTVSDEILAYFLQKMKMVVDVTIKGADTFGLDLDTLRDVQRGLALVTNAQGANGRQQGAQVGARAGLAARSRSVADNSTFEGGAITVVQRPGENGVDLARRVAREQRAEMERSRRFTDAAFDVPEEY